MSRMEAGAHPRNTNKENHMWGDELGKLHNILIRYNFTCLLDGLQGDTLKINLKPQKERKNLVNRRQMVKPGTI